MTKTVVTKKKTFTPALAPVQELANGKLQPQAIEKEELVLGKLLNNKNELARIVDRLRPHHFYRAQHQAMYEAMLRLFSMGKPIDLHTVVDTLRKEAKLEFAGGAHAVAMLSSQDSSASNIVHDCTIIIEMAMKRELIAMASTVYHDAHEYSSDASSLLDLAERTLLQIVDQNVRHNTNSIASAMQRALGQIQISMNLKNNGITGVPCGLTELDRMLSGWQNSDLIILAARPGWARPRQ